MPRQDMARDALSPECPANRRAVEYNAYGPY